MKKTINVARSEQAVLKAFNEGYYNVKIRRRFDGDVSVHINGVLVGFIPKTQLAHPLASLKECTGCIEKHGSKYRCVLTERIAPSSEQYSYMRRLCAEAGLPLPAYDERAYATYWARVMA